MGLTTMNYEILNPFRIPAMKMVVYHIIYIHVLCKSRALKVSFVMF